MICINIYTYIYEFCKIFYKKNENENGITDLEEKLLSSYNNNDNNIVNDDNVNDNNYFYNRTNFNATITLKEYIENLNNIENIDNNNYNNYNNLIEGHV